MKWLFISLVLLNLLMLCQTLVGRSKSSALLAGIDAEVMTLRVEISAGRLAELDQAKISASRDLARHLISGFQEPVIVLEIIGFGVSLVGSVIAFRRKKEG